MCKRFVVGCCKCEGCGFDFYLRYWSYYFHFHVWEVKAWCNVSKLWWKLAKECSNSNGNTAVIRTYWDSNPSLLDGLQGTQIHVIKQSHMFLIFLLYFVKNSTLIILKVKNIFRTFFNRLPSYNQQIPTKHEIWK